MLSVVFSATLEGAEGSVVRLQAVAESALPQVFVTGLPNTVIRESKERVRACLIQHGFDIPSRRVVVNLSPACTPKQGSQLDLAIALGCLGAEDMLPEGALDGVGFLGELALDGQLQSVPYALPLIESLEKVSQLHTIVVPHANEQDAALSGSRKVVLARDLNAVLTFLKTHDSLPRPAPYQSPTASKPIASASSLFDSITGQSLGKFALQVALAGEHHLLFVGPPGIGKSLLARSSAELLPPLDSADFKELVRIHALCGNGMVPSGDRPMRVPHHTSSAASILGGGNQRLIPGEASLAHGGVLFLDELAEFRRDVLEGMREPLEAKETLVRRVGQSHRFPARFTLIAAMNPCPCGNALGSSSPCTCSLGQRSRYLQRISGPLFDRFDLVVVLTKPKLAARNSHALTAAVAKAAVERAAELRLERQKSGVLLKPEKELKESDFIWFVDHVDRSEMSVRRAMKWLKVARTVADLNDEKQILREHLIQAQALSLQSLTNRGQGHWA